MRWKILTIVLALWALTTVVMGVDRASLFLSQITGGDENYIADVLPKGDGTKALNVVAEVTVDQLNGEPADGVTWAYIGTQLDADGVGADGDTVTTTIAAATPPLDTVYPAVSVVTNVTAGIVAAANPERALALQICDDLTADANFNTSWKCQVAKDSSVLFINSKLYNEFGWRVGCVPITDCFNMTTTGTTVVTVAFNEIKSHPLSTELQRSPNDPRKGTLNVAGSFTQQPGGTGDLLFEQLIDGGTPSMIVDGSVTPVNFRIECDPVDDKYIDILRIYLSCAGIKLDKWTCSNSSLTNGLLVTVRSEGADLTLLPLKTTNDIKNKFSIGDAGPTGQFRVDIQQGSDALVGALQFPGAAIIKKCGTNGTGTEDYIEIKVRDNLTGSSGGNMTEMAALVFGFRRTP